LWQRAIQSSRSVRDDAKAVSAYAALVSNLQSIKWSDGFDYPPDISDEHCSSESFFATGAAGLPAAGGVERLSQAQIACGS